MSVICYVVYEYCEEFKFGVYSMSINSDQCEDTETRFLKVANRWEIIGECISACLCKARCFETHQKIKIYTDSCNDFYRFCDDTVILIDYKTLTYNSNVFNKIKEKCNKQLKNNIIRLQKTK